MITLTATQTIDPSTLMRELKAVSSKVKRMTVRNGFIEVRGRPDQFTAQEQSALQTAATAHDGNSIIQLREQAKQDALDELANNQLRTLRMEQINAFIDNQVSAITNLAEAKQFLSRFCKSIVRYIRAREGE